MSELTVGFTGSRDYPHKERIRDFVYALGAKYPDATVVSGGRGNVDVTAETEALTCGLEVVSYRPTDSGIEVWKWDAGSSEPRVHPMMGAGGPNAFVRNCFARNFFIATSDRLVGFWDMQSRGTADTIKKGLGNSNRPVFVYGPTGELLTPVELVEAMNRMFG